MNKKIILLHRLFYYSLKCEQNPFTEVLYFYDDGAQEIQIYIDSIYYDGYNGSYEINFKSYKDEESLVYGV